MLKLENILLEQSLAPLPAVAKTSAVAPFSKAVINRNPISFDYYGPRKGKDAVKPGRRYKVEGVVLGSNKKGKMVLRAWVDPSSNSVSKKGFDKTSWRTFILARMKNVEIHAGEQFNTKRPDYEEGRDLSMSKIYAKSDWGKTIKPKKEVKPKIGTTKIQQKEPEVKPEVLSPELPTPSSETKPTSQPTAKITPQEKPTIEPATPSAPPQETPATVDQNLPQPKPEEKPPVNPEDEEDQNQLQESIRKIKRLMFY